jgi:urease accessory protein
MDTRRYQQLFIALCTLAVPLTASAHLIDAHGAGFTLGLLHPLTGLDHLLAMFAVGLWAWQLNGRALWAVPLAFVGMMVFGGALGMSGVALPFTETVIILSVLILGLMISFAVRVPTAIGMLLVGVFALFHGHSHGTELLQTASEAAYALGFVLSTAALHLTGIISGYSLSHFLSQRSIRIGGIGIAMAGVALLLGT